MTSRGCPHLCSFCCLTAFQQREYRTIPRVFFATAWPGTPLFATLEKQGRANRSWDQVRKDVPSIQFKHFTHAEAIAARKRILDAFFNVSSISRTLSRWVLRERTLILTCLKMVVRDRIAEVLQRTRAHSRPGA
jgi:hypothetical protein